MAIEVTTTLAVLLGALIVVAILTIVYFTTGQESSSLWTYSRGAMMALFGTG